MKPKASRNGGDNPAVIEYKRVLQQVLENRPSGTRQSLAEALGKHRSFISQITNPNYSVPIPARHIESIFEVCHFLGNEKAQFLDAYARAHSRRIPTPSSAEPRWRELVLRVPDFRDRALNRQLDDLLKETVQRIGRLVKQREKPSSRNGKSDNATGVKQREKPTSRIGKPDNAKGAKAITSAGVQK